MKTIRILFLLVSLGSLLGTSCEKLGGGKDDGDPEPGVDKKEEAERKSRALFNNAQMEGVGNVYVAEYPTTPTKQKLLVKADYQAGHLAYYVSPTSATDLGTDHRLVIGESKSEQAILEIDESKQTLRMYAEREGKRLPILLQISQSAMNQFEYQLLRVDWEKNVEEIVAGAFLRDGKPVGSFKASTRPNKAENNDGATDSIGFLGFKRPVKQGTVPATVSVFLKYFHQVFGPLIQLSNDGMGIISQNLEHNSVTSDSFGMLWYDLQQMDQIMDRAGSTFPSFKTDPIKTTDPLQQFKWYTGTGASAVLIKNAQLTALTSSSKLSFDTEEANSFVELMVQVQDKDKKSIVGQPVFVDFRLEIEQDGKTELINQQTLSSDKVKGQLVYRFDPKTSLIKPKAGAKINLLYRLSAQTGGTYNRQALQVIDRQPAQISIVSGLGQEVDWEEKLKLPFIVKVTNKAGQPVKNVGISWKVISSSWGIIVGTLSNTQFQTDSTGLAFTNYTVGKQQIKPETVTAQVIGADGQEIPNLSVTFSYKQKRNNFTLVQLRKDSDNDEKFSPLSEWKNGGAVTIMENELMYFNVKKDGKLVNWSTGSLASFVLSTKGFTNGTIYENKTFQAKDIVMKNFAVKFSDPQTGRMDSVVLDLTISNQLYRTFVGKTIRAEGNAQLDHEVLTFYFRPDGKVEMKSKNTPQMNRTAVYESVHTYRQLPVYECSVNGVMPYKMKTAIGEIDTKTGLSNATGFGPGFILFEDGTIRPGNMGIGFDVCGFNMFWKSIKLE